MGFATQVVFLIQSLHLDLGCILESRASARRAESLARSVPLQNNFFVPTVWGSFVVLESFGYELFYFALS